MKATTFEPMEFLTLKHSMPAGDLLSLLPGLKNIWEDTGKRWIIYQRVNLEYGDLYGAYIGAKYSIKNENDTPVTMNKAVFEALTPLLQYQDYIEEFNEWKGEHVDYDMDLLRQMDTTMPYGSISRWPWYIWPEMACDLSVPSLDVSSAFFTDIPLHEYILVNRTERYNNMLISYAFLNKYKGRVLFIGLPNEHEIFCKQNGIEIPLFNVSNFFDLGVALNNCKLFIGNQSMAFQIAEHLKIPRILEVCKQLPNVIGSGPGFYDFLNQRSLEYCVNKLYNE